MAANEYEIIDQTKEAHGYMKDASHPFLVRVRVYRSYRSGFSVSTVGRYKTKKSAQAAIRRHSAL